MTTIVTNSQIKFQKLDSKSVYFYSIVQKNICQVKYFLKRRFQSREKEKSERKWKLEITIAGNILYFTERI